jgi:hypothetical protein
VYTPAKAAILNADIDFATSDLRVMLIKLKAATSTDTEQDAPFIASFTTLGELAATNYVRKALAGKAVNEDDPGNLANMTANPVVWAALGGALNDTIGAILLFLFVTNDADSVPIAYIDNGGADFGLATNGGDITLNWSALGVLQET